MLEFPHYLHQIPCSSCHQTDGDCMFTLRGVQRSKLLFKIRPVYYKCSIDSLLDAGKYVMHHSKSYGVAYHPHYRIMRRDIFDKEILPYIKEYYITPSLDEK